MKNKKLQKIIIFSLIIIYIIFICSNPVQAADPKIVTKINKSLGQIKTWLIKLSTPAAAIAVGTGVFMKKFSFGDEEKIRTGKKLINNALFSYAFLLSIDLILAAIKSLVGVK